MRAWPRTQSGSGLHTELCGASGRGWVEGVRRNLRDPFPESLSRVESRVRTTSAELRRVCWIGAVSFCRSGDAHALFVLCLGILQLPGPQHLPSALLLSSVSLLYASCPPPSPASSLRNAYQTPALAFSSSLSVGSPCASTAFSRTTFFSAEPTPCRVASFPHQQPLPEPRCPH